jgi:uncharacterized membrane protein
MHGAAAIIWSLCGGGAMLSLAIGFANRVANGRPVRPQPPALDAHQQALNLLEHRYALGEIDRDEFLERRGYLELSRERQAELP